VGGNATVLEILKNLGTHVGVDYPLVHDHATLLGVEGRRIIPKVHDELTRSVRFVDVLGLSCVNHGSFLHGIALLIII
jgi:hypothetical protein